MDKMKAIVYTMVIVLAIAMLYISYQNMQINKKLVEEINLCQLYAAGEMDKIQERCMDPTIARHLSKRTTNTLDLGTYYNISIPSQ